MMIGMTNTPKQKLMQNPIILAIKENGKIIFKRISGKILKASPYKELYKLRSN